MEPKNDGGNNLFFVCVCVSSFFIISAYPICKNFDPRVFRNMFYQSDDTYGVTWPMKVMAPASKGAGCFREAIVFHQPQIATRTISCATQKDLLSHTNTPDL